VHKRWEPVHVTLRGLKGLPSFRSQRLYAAFVQTVRLTNARYEDFLIVDAFGRERGKLWGDRYHRRDLKTPRQVRNALVYVLANYKKHFRITHGRPQLDPCSSAAWFEGWVTHLKPPDIPPPVAAARTLLLRSLWQKHGLIHPGEYPKLPS